MPEKIYEVIGGSVVRVTSPVTEIIDINLLKKRIQMYQAEIDAINQTISDITSNVILPEEA